MTDTIPRQAVIDAIEGLNCDPRSDRRAHDAAIAMAIAAINAIPAVDEWQTIETAPKDGTKVDLWCGNHRRTEKKFAVHSWLDGKPMAEPCWGPYDGREEGPLQPTHWRPLPNPPLLAALGE